MGADVIRWKERKERITAVETLAGTPKTGLLQRFVYLDIALQHFGHELGKLHPPLLGLTSISPTC